MFNVPCAGGREQVEVSFEKMTEIVSLAMMNNDFYHLCVTLRQSRAEILQTISVCSEDKKCFIGLFVSDMIKTLCLGGPDQSMVYGGDRNDDFTTRQLLNLVIPPE